MYKATIFTYPNGTEVILTTPNPNQEDKEVILALYNAKVKPHLWSVGEGLTLETAIQNARNSLSWGNADLNNPKGLAAYYEHLAAPKPIPPDRRLLQK